MNVADASTVYSNSQSIIVAFGTPPISAPWLARTTYLIDNEGQTTGVLAQTDQPTSGVPLAPVPYTTQIQTALPSTTASNLPSEWAYQGCYNDVYPSGRVLPLKQPNNPNLTVQACVWSCYQLDYSISGVEFGKQCFCGNAIYSGGALSQWDFDCNMHCSGSTTDICGGSNKMSVYSNGTLTTHQPGVALTSGPTTTAPTTAPSPTSSTSRLHVPTTVIAAAVLGIVAGVAIILALVFYIRWWIRGNRLRTDNQVQTLQLTSQAWPSMDRVPSWKEFVKETEEYYTDIDESTMRERYEQMRRNHLQRSHTGWQFLDTHLALPAKSSPPRIAPARARLNQPTSILKRPTITRTMDRTQSMSTSEEEQVLKGNSATRNLALAKKGVRFGVNQIREFGRSPLVGQGSEFSTT